MSKRRRRSWKKRQERVVYLGLITAAVLLALGIRVASQFSVDVRFIFLALVIVLLIGIVIVVAKKFN